MCGIFCAFGINQSKLNVDTESLLSLSQRLLSNRGPDDFRYVLDDQRNFFFAHSRLAIQGLASQVVQPFKCKDGSLLVYNGEIYNKHELSCGINSEDCDTPIFSNQLLKGKAGLEAVDGMYAFVEYNSRNNRVRFGRDRFGEKPLKILTTHDFVFLFSEYSYLPIIHLICGFVPRLDLDLCERYILYGYRQVNDKERGITLFDSINDVKPSSLHTLDLGSGNIKEDYILTLREIFETTGPKQTTQCEINHILISEISKRCISDVKSGLCLSGGIDSNLLLSILSKSDTPPSMCFTIHSDDPRYSEAELADKAAKIQNIDHALININDQSVSPLNNFLTQTKQRQYPFFTMSSFVSTYIAEEASKNNIKVIFGGSGGDEIFSGYYDYFYYRMMDEGYTSKERNDFFYHVFPCIKNPIMRLGVDGINRINNLEHHYFDFSRRLDFMNSSVISYSKPPEIKLHNMSRLKERQYNDLAFEAIPIILHEDDVNYMSHSVENRSPFLTKKILELGLFQQDIDLMSNGKQKYCLRSFLRLHQPELSFIYNNTRKQGFNYSCFELIESDKDLFYDLMNTDSMLWNLVDKNKFIQQYHSNNISETSVLCVLSLQALLA